MKKKVRDIVNAIRNESTAYTNYVTQLGNECAYTDSMLENIVRLAEELADIAGINQYLAVILEIKEKKFLTFEMDGKIVKLGDLSEAIIFYDEDDAECTLERLNDNRPERFAILKLSKEELRDARNGNNS